MQETTALSFTAIFDSGCLIWEGWVRIEKGHPRWWRVTFFWGIALGGAMWAGWLFDEFGGGGAGGGAGGHYVDACREVADVE